MSILGITLLLLALWFLSGFLTRVAGRWRDGERLIELHQFGPWIWGAATFAQGQQNYFGMANLGRVKLKRRDSGRQHLLALGFTPAQVQWMNNQITGHLELRCSAATLSGVFVGRKFSFDEDGIRAVTAVEPVARTWQRLPT